MKLDIILSVIQFTANSGGGRQGEGKWVANLQV